MLGACAGAQVISTVQARVDGAFPSARTPFPKGSTFRWFGTPLRLDGARASLLLGGAEGQAELRARVPHTVAKFSRGRGSAAIPISLADAAEDPAALVLTAGERRWMARAVATRGGETLLVFAEGLPPANTALRIAQAPTMRAGTPPRDTFCFTPGTMIETPGGTCPVENVAAGDRVITRDDGPQEVLWVGLRHVSGTRMFGRPGLRPVRLRAGTFGNDADLVVSPGHRILLAGRAAQVLWSTPEVLVRAADLIDDRRVTADHAATSVTYVHLLTRHHQVLRANGIWCESFHPGATDLDHLHVADREALLALVPGADSDAQAYGAAARRCLSAAELAIQRHEGAPRHLA